MNCENPPPCPAFYNLFSTCLAKTSLSAIYFVKSADYIASTVILGATSIFNSIRLFKNVDTLAFNCTY